MGSSSSATKGIKSTPKARAKRAAGASQRANVPAVASTKASKRAPTASGRTAAGQVGTAQSFADLIDPVLLSALVEKWTLTTATVSAAPPTAPIAVIIAEALLLAPVYQQYWQSEDPEFPSFGSVQKASRLHESSGRDLFEVAIAVSVVQADYNKASEGLGPSPMPRARYVFRELKATLAFVLEDGGKTTPGAQFEKVSREFARPASQDEMAIALEAFADLAREHVDAVQNVAGFQLEMLDEAWALAGALRRRSAERLIADKVSGSGALFETRNQMLNFLAERCQSIRKTGRYLFRDYPDIAKTFASDYQRTRQREYKHRLKRKAKATQSEK